LEGGKQLLRLRMVLWEFLYCLELIAVSFPRAHGFPSGPVGRYHHHHASYGSYFSDHPLERTFVPRPLRIDV